MQDLWSPSSWSSKPIAQVSRSYTHKNPLVEHNSFQGCPISRSTSSCKVSSSSSTAVPQSNSLSRVLSKLSTLPPMVTPSEVGLIVLERKATWISAEIDAFLCSRSNVYAISSASFNATRPFCFMLVTVLRASTLVPTYVSSNSYVTYSYPSLQLALSMCTGEHLLENRTHPFFFLDSHMGGSFTCRMWILLFPRFRFSILNSNLFSNQSIRCVSDVSQVNTQNREAALTKK
jgi:hypothetical protein